VNLAVPALVILLGLLPGICFFYGYFAGRFDRRLAGITGVGELAFYVVFAIPIDAGSLFVGRLFGVDLDFTVVARLLLGTVSDITIPEIAGTLRRFSGSPGLIYWAVLAASYGLGSIGRRLVWAFRLDTVFSLLRLRHAWFYLLQGRQRGMPRVVLAYVDVLTEHPEDRSRLYRGLVVDFEIAANGDISSLTLHDTQRGKGRGDDFAWRPIPSNRLTIMGSTIHSINVTYIALDEQPQHGWRRWLARVRSWWRSFIAQEP